MMVGENFVYIQFPKCACTFISEVINRFSFGKELGGVPTKMLNPDKIPLEHRNKTIITSIRNPWEWYVSFWAYKHYVKLSNIKEKIGDPYHINYHYNPELDFKNYLGQIFDDERNKKLVDKKINICNGTYAFKSMVEQDIGLYTFHWQKKSQNMVDRYFRVENLWEDMSIFFEIPVRNLKKVVKINVSPHEHYNEYYDDELRDLVAKKDKTIIDKFGYTFETKQSEVDNG